MTAEALGAHGLPLSLDERISEDAFDELLRQLLDLCGFRHYHTRSSVGSPAGFPDRVAVHAERRLLLLIELKRQRGRVEPAQAAWLDDLGLLAADVNAARAGTPFHPVRIVVRVWRPSDWPAIVELVSGGRLVAR